MPPATQKVKRIRLSLDLTEKQFAKLTKLEQQLDTTKAEIVRDALRLYEYVAQRSLAGDSLRAISKEGKESNLVLMELIQLAE